jgi:hypothetical protein
MNLDSDQIVPVPLVLRGQNLGKFEWAHVAARTWLVPKPKRVPGLMVGVLPVDEDDYFYHGLTGKIPANEKIPASPLQEGGEKYLLNIATMDDECESPEGGT